MVYAPDRASDGVRYGEAEHGADDRGRTRKRTCVLRVVKPTAERAAGKAGPLARLHLTPDRRVVPNPINWYREVDVVDTTRIILRASLWGLKGCAAGAARPVAPLRALRGLKGDNGEVDNSERDMHAWQRTAARARAKMPPRSLETRTRLTYQILGKRGDWTQGNGEQGANGESDHFNVGS